jgi:hypothetical protein
MCIYGRVQHVSLLITTSIYRNSFVPIYSHLCILSCIACSVSCDRSLMISPYFCYNNVIQNYIEANLQNQNKLKKEWEVGCVPNSLSRIYYTAYTHTLTHTLTHSQMCSHARTRTIHVPIICSLILTCTRVEL